MPLVRRRSLRDRLNEGRIPAVLVRQWLVDVAVVTDFGIAKAIDSLHAPDAGLTLTRAGAGIGTPADMAPEQVAGESQMDARADLYAFGLLAWELFEGQGLSLREIAERRQVSSIVEESVRCAGPRVRVQARLLDVESGFQQWSDRYDGERDDVFALQDEIARRVHPITYQRYLQATHLLRGHVEAARYAEGQALVEEAIRLDPTSAPAHAALGVLHISPITYGIGDVAAHMPAAQQAFHKALTLAAELAVDPVSAGVVVAGTNLLNVLGYGDEAVPYIAALLHREPQSGIAWCINVQIRAFHGELTEDLRLAERYMRVAPRSAAGMAIMTGVLAMLGRVDEARGLATEMETWDGPWRSLAAWLATAWSALDEERLLCWLDQSVQRFEFWAPMNRMFLLGPHLRSIPVGQSLRHRVFGRDPRPLPNGDLDDRVDRYGSRGAACAGRVWRERGTAAPISPTPAPTTIALTANSAPAIACGRSCRWDRRPSLCSGWRALAPTAWPDIGRPRAAASHRRSELGGLRGGTAAPVASTRLHSAIASSL